MAGDLLERESELEALGAVLAAARAGHGGVAMVEGPAGIGKSRLLDAARAAAGAAGMEVLRATGRELETEASFGVATELFEPRPVSVGGVDPAAADTPALLRELYWVAVDLAGATGLAILIDDAQWCDRPSLAFLAHLATRLEEVPIALLVAARAGGPGTDAAALGVLRGAAGSLLRPRPLGPDAVATLVRAELPDADDALVTACGEVTAGNPFMVIELGRLLRTEAVPPGADSVAAVRALVPETVMHTLLTQLGRLGAEAEAIAAAAAVLGDDAPLRQVGALAKVDAAAAERAADALAAAGILAPGEPIRFAHPLIATAVRADLSEFARARAHREAADLLAADGAPLREVAAHLPATRPDADPWVLATLREAAGRAVVQGDPTAAARLLARAAAEPPPPERRGEVLLELAEAEALAGDTAAGAHVEEALAALPEGAARGRALRSLGRIRLAAGEPAVAAEALAGSLAALDADLAEDQAILGEYLTVNRFHAPLLPAADARLGPIVDATRAGSPPADPVLLVHAVLSLALAGEAPTRVRELAGRAAAALDPALDVAAFGLPSGMLVQALCVVDATDQAGLVGAAALAEARRRGAFIATTSASFHRAIPRVYRGELTAAMDDLGGGQATREEGWDAALAWPLSLQAHLQLERGELVAARESVATAVAPEGSMERAVLDFADAAVALAERRPAAAREAAEAAGALLGGGFRVDTPGLLPWRRPAALAALALGEEARARALAAEQLEIARAAAAPRPLALALRTAAAVGLDEPLAPLEEARAVLDDGEPRLERVHVLAELGAAMRRAGRRRDCQEPLRQALQLADAMGARAVAESALAELRATGARPRRAAFSGVDSLTPAELRVARLAAEGLTNREIAGELFVTAKTVQTHLSSVYRKLDAASREELPGLLASRVSS
ncbi:MAG: helix-turn-helix domain-containing protein [Actinobacteria bacterium]|nr:helix-turn-helix domain-containing protein [Actinomycetota bacterium]